MCYSLRRVVSHQSLHVSSGSSLVGHVLLWIRGSWFWRKGVGGWREETLWGISYPLACEPDEMRGPDLDATLGLLPRIVCQEVVIMPRLDLWKSHCSCDCCSLCLAASLCCSLYFLSFLPTLASASFHSLDPHVVSICDSSNTIELSSYLSLSALSTDLYTFLVFCHWYIFFFTVFFFFESSILCHSLFYNS